MAGINLNPYQGLKQPSRLAHRLVRQGRAGINLNPYQGLKPSNQRYKSCISLAGINLNPYQGLKLSVVVLE